MEKTAKRGNIVSSSLVDLWEGAKEVNGGAALVGVADELGVELLVAGQGDASGLLVVILLLEKNIRFRIW